MHVGKAGASWAGVGLDPIKSGHYEPKPRRVGCAHRNITTVIGGQSPPYVRQVADQFFRFSEMAQRKPVSLSQ